MSEWKQDAGHGGSDPGGVANGQQEKHWSLEAALYVDKRLGELRISSTMTRSKDVTLAQSSRTGQMKKAPKGISHHFNMGGGNGAEFIYSIHANGKFEKLLAEEFEKAGYPLRPREIYTRKYGSDDYYYMHRETGSCRVTIIEYDFLDGPNFNKLKSKSYREGMYECVVKAVCREEGVNYVAPGQKISSGDTYTVRTGDTLWRIAKDNDTTVAVLKQLNGLKNDLILPGQKLKLPGASKPEYYVIEKGDTFWSLENKLKLKHGTLQKLNPEVNPKWLKIGQRIRVK